MVAPTIDGLRFKRATAFDGISTSFLPAARQRRRQLTSDNRLIDGSDVAPRRHRHRGREPAAAALCPTSRRWRFRQVPLDREQPARQLSPAEVSDQPPDLHVSGLLSATRLQMRFDTWAYPFDGSGADSTQGWFPDDEPDRPSVDALGGTRRRADCLSLRQRRSRQYLGDVGERAAANHLRAGSRCRDWRPDLGHRMVDGLPSCRRVGNGGFAFGVWLVRPDGSELRQLLPRGLGVAWSPDSEEPDHAEVQQNSPIKKVSVAGGDPVTVRAGQKPDRRAGGISCMLLSVR